MYDNNILMKVHF